LGQNHWRFQMRQSALGWYRARLTTPAVQEQPHRPKHLLRLLQAPCPTDSVEAVSLDECSSIQPSVLCHDFLQDRFVFDVQQILPFARLLFGHNNADN